MSSAHAETCPYRRPWISLTLWTAAIALAVAAGSLATPPRLPDHAGPGPLFPRIPAPPPDLRTLLHQLGVGSVMWYAGALALPFLAWAARRLEGRRRARSILLALAALSLLVGGTSVVSYLVAYRRAPARPALSDYLAVELPRHLLPWIAIAGVVVAVEALRRALRAAVERERLRAQVAEQRLIALSSQLQPHFLFNTLQGISTLLHRDPEAADEMLGKLSELLRDVLRHRDRVLVPLGEELRYARTYLEIARLRFADRLAFEIDVPEDLHALAVPLFILQPLVENALAHGIGARLRGGRITLRGRRDADRLWLEVADDGAGLPAGAAPAEGVGMSNTRDRLRASFGTNQTLTLAPCAGGGTVARIDMPCRRDLLLREPP
jgi:signal transduction histidine kinase